MTLPTAVTPRSRRHGIIFGLLMLVGVVLRVVGFPHLPAGLDVDEVSSSYESWSLLLTHAESWGNQFPVYFSQQGGGQNVLYSYLNIPFIALFGPTLLGARLLALIVGLLTLPLMYITVRRWFGNTVALVALGLTAIMPWHVMLSHWALESNLLPFVILLAVYVTTVAVQAQSRACALLALPLLVLGCYAYGIACIPLFILIALTLVFYHRQIRGRLGWWAGGLGIAVVLVAPFLLLVGKIYLHLSYPFERALPFSLPTLNRNRLQDLQQYGGAPLPTSLKLVFLNGSNDYNPNSSLPYGSPFPSIIAWVAVLYVLYRVIWWVRASIQQHHVSLPKPSLIELWLVAVPSIWFVIPVIVRETNAFYLPAIAVAAAAIVAVCRKVRGRIPKLLTGVLITVLALYNFVPALVVYYNGWYADYATTAFKDMTTPLHKVLAQSGDEQVYAANGLNFTYLYVLWDLKIEPDTFRAAHPTYANPDFNHFVFKPQRVDQTQAYWYVVPTGNGPIANGLTCQHPAHQQIVDNQWRIGQCLPAG